MFTGIIEAALPLASVEDSGGLRRLRIDLGVLPETDSVRLGDSVAVNGVCLTIARLEGRCATFEAVPETLSRTSLGGLKAGDAVNVERALKAGARLDGHMVQGHADGLGRIERVEPAGGEWRIRVHCGEAFARQCVPKGSVCVDGISLTIAELGPDHFTVAIIPHTREITNLRHAKPGAAVNLEADVIGKYVLAHLQRMFPEKAGGVDEALLRRAGFLGG